MSSHGGAAANQVSDRIKTGIDAVIAEDRYNSQHGFRPHREKARKDLTKEEIERMRSPETIAQIFADEDADTRLLRGLLCERRGLRDVGRRIGQSFVGKAAGTLAVGYATRDVAQVGMHVAAAEITKESGAAAAAAAMGAAAPFVSAAIGATTGGFWGWIRGKNQEYSAATWMQNLDVLSATEEEISKMTDEELFVSLGVLKNVIDRGGVRGRSIHKLEMAVKYNQIKNLLRQRVIEARAGSGELNPVLARLDAAIDGSRREGKKLSEAAGEELKEVYQRILKMKKKKVTATVIKGAVIGGTIGGLLKCVSLLASHSPWVHNVAERIQQSEFVHNLTEWGREHMPFLFGGVDGADAGGSDLLHQKMEALRQGELTPEIVSHDANYQALDSFIHNPPLNPPDMAEGGANSPLAHFSNLHDMDIQLDNTAGFHEGGLGQFNGLLNSGNAREMIDFAAVHNIDIASHVANGQPLSQFLLDNKESFLQLPPEAQNFVLSHPSVADQFIGAVQQQSPEGFSQWVGMMMNKVNTIMPQLSADQWNTVAKVGAGVAGVAAFAGSNSSKRKAETRIGDIIDGAVDRDHDSMIAWRREQETAEQERREQRLEAVRAELEDSKIIFNPALLAKLGYAIPSNKRKNEFVVDRVDEDGRILFMYTEKDLNMVRSGVAPHPKVTVDDIVDADNRIDRDMLVICEAGSRKDASAATDTEELDLKEFDPFLSRNNMYGTVKKKNGKTVFVLNSAVNGRKELLIDIPVIESAMGILPSNTRYKADFNQVKDVGGEPQFGGNILFESGGESFYIGSVYTGYQPKTKDPLIQEMRSVNKVGGPSNIILYLSSANLFCRFTGISAGATKGASDKFKFNELDNSGTAVAGATKEIEEKDLRALQIVKFSKK